MKLEKESQRPILPKNLFICESTWLCYESYSCPMSWLISAFWVAIGLLMLRTSADDIYSIIFQVVLPSVLLIKNTVIIYTKSLKRQRKYSSRLAQEMFELNPGLDIEKWDLIASNLNRRFYQSYLWRTPYFFFDGQDAVHLFRRNVLQLFLHKDISGGMNANEIESVRNYLQLVDETIESYLKKTLPEHSTKSSLTNQSRRSGFLCTFAEYLPAWDVCVAYVSDAGATAQQLNAIRSLMDIFSYKSLLPDFFPFMLNQCLSLSRRYADRPCGCREMNIMDAIKFLVMIIKLKPGSRLDKWDEIASYMKEYPINEQTSNTSTKFSDGKHCMKFYKTYLQSLSSEKGQCAYHELKRVREIVLQHLD